MVLLEERAVKKMSNNRSANLDLLRFFSVIAVIMIHVSSAWVADFTESVSANQQSLSQLIHPFIACIYNSISRFAVPCFLMISGSFLLCNDKNMDYKYFYTKKVFSTLKIIGVFSVAYVLYRVSLMLLGFGNDNSMSIFFDVLKGAPMYHMWYMYMLIFIYLAVPIVIRFKKSISFMNYKRVTCLFFLFAIISRWTAGNVTLNWDIGQAFEFLSFLMIGDVIRAETRPNNIIGVIMIFLGFGIEILTAYLEYCVQIVNGINESNLSYRIVDAYTPTIAVASVLIFMGFSRIQVKHCAMIDFVVNYSLLVYLIHAGVIDFIKQSCKWLFGGNSITNFDCIWAIPVFVLITLLLSLLLSYTYVLCRNFLMLQRR